MDVRLAWRCVLVTGSTAVDVRMAIQRLSAECAIARKDMRRPVHRQFVRMAARHPFRSCVVDAAQGKIYRYGEALAVARIVSKLLAPVLGDAPMVGIWLPPGTGGSPIRWR